MKLTNDSCARVRAGEPRRVRSRHARRDERNPVEDDQLADELQGSVARDRSERADVVRRHATRSAHRRDRFPERADGRIRQRHQAGCEKSDLERGRGADRGPRISGGARAHRTRATRHAPRPQRSQHGGRGLRQDPGEGGAWPGGGVAPAARRAERAQDGVRQSGRASPAGPGASVAAGGVGRAAHRARVEQNVVRAAVVVPVAGDANAGERHRAARAGHAAPVRGASGEHAVRRPGSAGRAAPVCRDQRTQHRDRPDRPGLGGRRPHGGAVGSGARHHPAREQTGLRR